MGARLLLQVSEHLLRAPDSKHHPDSKRRERQHERGDEGPPPIAPGEVGDIERAEVEIQEEPEEDGHHGAPREEPRDDWDELLHEFLSRGRVHSRERAPEDSYAVRECTDPRDAEHDVEKPQDQRDDVDHAAANGPAS